MYRSIPHTADLAYEIRYSDIEELFQDLVNIIRENAEFEEGEKTKEISYTFHGDITDLVFDVVNDLIYSVERGWIPKRVRFDGEELRIVFNKLKDLHSFPIKALTYHMLKVDRVNSQNRIKVVFDI